MALQSTGLLGSVNATRGTGTENRLLKSSLPSSHELRSFRSKLTVTADSNLNVVGIHSSAKSLVEKYSLVSTRNSLLETKTTDYLGSQLQKLKVENSLLKRKQDDCDSLPATETKRFQAGNHMHHRMSISSVHSLDEEEAPKYSLQSFTDMDISRKDDIIALNTLDEKKQIIHVKRQALKAQILRTVSTSLVNKPLFKDRNDQTRQSLMAQAAQITKFDPEFILKVALYTRQELNIRTTSNFLLSLAANINECKNYLRKYYCAAIRLPSDWLEVAELYQTFEDKNVKTNSIPAMLRKQMILKFSDFDEYQLGKYNKKKRKPKSAKKAKDNKDNEVSKEDEDLSKKVKAIEEVSVVPCEPEDPEIEKKAFTLKRLIRLLHIKTPHQEVMALLGKKYPSSAEEFRSCGLTGIWDKEKAGKRMKLAVPVTWETQLAEKGNTADVWQELLDSKKLPYMAMLRNLCNLLRANISAEHNRTVMNLLSNKKLVEKSRQFPIAFFNAYKSIAEMEKISSEMESKMESMGQRIKSSKTKNAENLKRIMYLKNLKKRLKNINFSMLSLYMDALEKAIEIAVEKNVNPVPGRTLVICDIHSYNDVKKLQEEAMLLGVICIHACEDCDLKMADSAGWKSADIDDKTILANVKDKLNEASTMTFQPEAYYGEHFRKLTDHYLDTSVIQEIQLDNVILLTNGEKFEETQGPKIIKSFLWMYRNLVNPRLLYVQVDIPGKSKYRSSPQDSYLDVHLSGSSDQLLRFLAENGSEAQVAYVENIDKTYKLKALPQSLLPVQPIEPILLQEDHELSKKQRTVRVFISSTFRDMHGERDMLVRYVFPELRARCRAHGLHVQEVDLRWGITQEDAESQKSLELCLSEVSRCHMFVGILGDRYGAVPSPESLPKDPKFSWVNDYPAGASVTELEMYAAALAYPESVQGRAFFYLRDNAFFNTLPVEIQPDFFTEDNKSASKMASLKEQVRKSGLEVFNGYPCHWGGIMSGVPLVFGLEVFGQRVLDNLWNAIQKYYLAPGEIENGPLPLARQMSEDSDPVPLIGRASLLESCTTLVNSSSMEMVMVTGKMGSGKSAFLKHLHSEVLKTDSFLCDIVDDTKFQEITEVYQHLWTSVSRKFQLNFQLPKQNETLRSVFWRVMKSAARKSPTERLVLIFDGVDHLKSLQEQCLSWLPANSDESIIIVLSATEGSQSHRSVLSRSMTKIQSVFLSPISMPDRKSLVSSILVPHGKALSEDPFDNQMMQLVNKRDAGYPMYLHLACMELRMYGLYENLTQKIRSLNQTLPQLIQENVVILEKCYGKDLIQHSLCFISLAREGLSDVELQMLLGVHLNCAIGEMDVNAIKETFLHYPLHYMMAPMQFAMLVRSLRDFLSGTNMANWENRLAVTSSEMQKIIHSLYVRKMSRKNIMSYHKVLAGLFLSEGDPNPLSAWKACAPEAVRSLPHHLMSAHCLSDLTKVLCSLPFLMSTIQADFDSALSEEVAKFLLEAQNDSSLSAFASDLGLQDYMQFLKKNLYIQGMCYPLLIQQALCEPQDSLVFKDALKLKDNFNVFLPSENLYVDDCQKTITGFPSDLLCVASDALKQCLAVGCADGTCLLLDESNGNLLHSFMGHNQSICAVSFVGAQLLCTASLDGTLSLWNTQTGSRVSVLTGHRRRVSSCCSEKSGKTVVSGSWDHSILIWNVHTGQETSSLDNKCPVNCVAHHPVKSILASGDWKGKVKLWDLETLTRKSIFHGHVTSVTCLVFSEEGALLASGSLNGEIILWSLISGTQISKPCRHLNSVQSLAFDGSNLISAATDGTLKVWASHWNSARWTETVMVGRIHMVHMLSDKLLVAASDQGTVLVFTVDEELIFKEDTGESITSISKFSMHGTEVHGVLVGTHSGHVKLSKLEGPRKFLQFVNVQSYSLPVSSLCSQRGMTFVGCDSGHLALIQMKPPEVASSDLIEAHESCVTSITVMTNKRILTTSKDRTFKLWYPDERHTKLHFVKLFQNCHSDWITCSAYSSEIHSVITGSQDATLKIWNLKTEKVDLHLTGLNEPVAKVHLIDDRILVTGAYGSLGVWTLNGTLLAVVPSPHKEQRVLSTIFQKDTLVNSHAKAINASGFMVTADENKTLSLREVFTLSMSKQFVGHTDSVLGCSSPLNNRVVSTSLDKSLKWWTLEDTRNTDIANSSVKIIHSGNKVTAVNFSANGQRCLSADAGGTVALWTLQKDKISYLCHITHPHASVAKAVFANESGTKLAYPVKTPSEMKLVFCTEAEGTLSVERESELYDDVTCMEYSVKYDVFICGNRTGNVRMDSWINSVPFNLVKNWILEAKFHPQEIEKFYLALPSGTVRVTSTSYASQVSDKVRAPLPPMAKCFITALDVSDNGEVYAGQADGFLRVSTQSGVSQFKAHQNAVTGIKVCGHNLFTSSKDGTIKVWTRNNFTQIGEFRTKTSVTAMSVLPTSQETKKVLYGTSSGNLQLLIWNPKNK